MVERADIQQVLLQMRAMKAQAQHGVNGAAGLPESARGGVQAVDGQGFGDLLKQAVNSVHEQQQAAGKLTQAFERGDPGVDLPEVMIGLQKASVSFQAMTQVRNRLVSAYEDIMKMPI